MGKIQVHIKQYGGRKMTKEQTIKYLEEENSKIIAENKKLKEFIHNIKNLLNQDNDSLPT